jgi:hypothetical protein
MNESISALCRRIAALRLNDDGPTKTKERKPSDDSKCMAESNTTLSFETNRPHWAPQFRPNSLSVPSTTARSPATTNGTSSPKEPQPCLTSFKASPPSFEILDDRRKEARVFPLSAFLACPDATGRYPSRSKFLEAKPKISASQIPDGTITIPPATHAQKIAVSAACCALTLRKIRTHPVVSSGLDPRSRRVRRLQLSPWIIRFLGRLAARTDFWNSRIQARPCLLP